VEDGCGDGGPVSPFDQVGHEEDDSVRWTDKKGAARWLIMLAVIAMLAAACSSDDSD
jgi:hypothetical protein